MYHSDTNAIHRPSKEQLEAIADSVGLSLNEAELADYHDVVNATLDGLEQLHGLPTPQFGPHKIEYTDREPGYRPDPKSNPHNIWITKGRVEGAAEGPLDDKEIALKDNVALAGYELTAGSRVLEGFVPRIDATVVTRLLDAGATITGKLNQESFAFSGSGSTSDFGPVTNPRDDDHLAGGSSSGSAAAVAAGECDIAIGGDQAGSIRIPSSWCGVVGLKPTHGLVPYTGILPLDMSLDHAGPIATSVADVATTLEAIAGEDVYEGLKMDPRQPRGVESEPYADALGESVDGLSVGVLAEGFGWEFSDPAVDECVRDAIDVLAAEGAETEQTSMALHRASIAIWEALGLQGGSRMFKEAGTGSNHNGWQWEGLVDVLGKVTEARPDDLPPSIKRVLLAGAYLDEEYNNSYYARGRNLALESERRFNKLLDEYDVLALPTMAFTAYEQHADQSRGEQLAREPPIIANTCLFDLTGHPAITVPCGTVGSLPVGLMLVGAHFDEETLIAAANAFENAVDWQSR
ncbi:amidase [Halobellus sp. GM3]|uniref:amidase n=1 Tax=Halobellus sp. GM3 TaxID=3458410 RepID=UPI00403D8E37